jgi:outer membrane protein assembly factor BamB
MVKVIDRNNLMRFLSILMVWILISLGFVGINILVDDVSANEPLEESHSLSTMGLANSPWPCFRGNYNHTGRSPYDTTYNAGKLVWKYETGSRVHTSPVIDSNGTIYIGSKDGYFYTLNPNGTVKWKYNAGYAIQNTCPAIDSNGTIYFHADDFYALYPNGTKKWSKDIIVLSAPAIGLDGLVYVGSSEKVYALDPDNKGGGWIFNVPGCSIYSSPAVGSDGTLYFVGYDYFYAVYPNGTLRWKYATKDGNSFSSPAIGSDGTIYFGCDNYFFALYPNGTLRWKYKVGYSLNSSPAIGPDGTLYFYPSNNGLIALNPNGTRKWGYATSIVSSNPAIGAEGTIYFGTTYSGNDPQYLKALNPDGTLRWQYETEDYVSTSPAIGKNGTIYFGSGDWYVYAIGGYNHPPVANAGLDHNVTVNQKVHFNGSDSYDLSNDTLSYFWDFGDGNFTGWQSSSKAYHTYTVSDFYTAKLKVTDGIFTDIDICKVWVLKQYILMEVIHMIPPMTHLAIFGILVMVIILAGKVQAKLFIHIMFRIFILLH